MTSPHPQREEAARLWPEYHTPKPRSFVISASAFFIGSGIGAWLYVLYKWFF